MYATTEAEFTASGTAGVLVDCYIPLWGCPFSFLSDNGLQLYSKLSPALGERLGINKITIPAPTTVSNASITRWPSCSPWSATKNKKLGPTTPERRERLQPLRQRGDRACPQRKGRLLRFSLTIFDPQTLADIKLTSTSLLPASNAYRAVREFHAINVSRTNRRNAPNVDAFRRPPPFTVVGWACI